MIRLLLCTIALMMAIEAVYSLEMASNRPLGLEEAVGHLVQYMNVSHSDSGLGADLCDKYTCCKMDSGEKCSLSGLQQGKSTLVLPGGQTQCIYESSSPYAFQVIPGKTNKVLVYFGGGGACWDSWSANLNLCSTSVSPISSNGMFDRSDTNRNRFADYTVINLLYCSGDVWSGNKVQSYTHKGSKVTQFGLINAQATVDWIQLQQKDGQISATIDELILTGSSAGSIGIQIWATTILEALQWKSASVIADSYVGVFPDNTQGPLMYSYGFCDWDHLSPSLKQSCLDQSLSIVDNTLLNMKLYSSVPWAFIQSKVDIVQQSFYVALGMTSSNASAVITPYQFYTDVNDIFAVYNREIPNFVTYLVDGDQHEYVYKSLYYTADGLGPDDNNSAENTDIMLTAWANKMPLNGKELIDSVCLGPLNAPTDQQSYDWCSAAVIPKEYTQQG